MQEPPDLPAALGMVTEFATEPPAPITSPEDFAPSDPDRIGGLPIAVVAQACLTVYAAGGPASVQTFLATINDTNEEDA